MRKITLLIASLFITIGAMAQSNSYTRIAEFEAARTNSKVYALKTTRSPLYFNTEHNELAGYWTEEAQALQGGQANAAATAQQFAFLRTNITAEGQYYMYSVEGQCFITTTGAKSEEPGILVSFADVTDKDDANHQGLKLYLGTTGDNVVNVTYWNSNTAGGVRYNTNADADAGNVYELIAYDQDVDLSEAIAKIEAYEGTSKISDFYAATTTFSTYSGTISNIINGNTGDKWWSNEGQAVDKNITVVLNNVHQVRSIKWYFCDNDKPNRATIERKATADGEWIEVADFTSNDIKNNVFTCTAGGNDVKELRLRITTEHSNWLQVAEVELYELIDVDIPVHEVIYNYVENDVVVGTMTYNVAEGYAYPDVVSGLYGVTVTGSKPAGNVTAPGTHVIAVEIGEMPFEYYENYAAVEEANGWYNLIMHSNWNTGADTGRYRTYLSHNESGSTLAWGTDRSLTNPRDAYYWAFVGNPINGFRVVNKATGAEKVLSSNGTTNPQMTATEGMADGYNTTWQVAGRKYDVSTEGDFIREGAWFCLKYPGSNNYINANARDGNVAFWSDNDNGSGILAVKPLTINEAADIATFYTDNYVKMPSTLGAEVYYATEVVNSNYIHLEQIEGEVIPAQTGVVVKYAVESNVVYAPEITSQGTTTAVEGNLLKGTTKRTLISKNANKSYYVLGMTDGVGFYNAVNGANENEFYNGAFKAYLELPADAGSANVASYSFRFGEGTTGIEEVEVENDVKVIYDLQGRRVNEITEKGIYIVNGNKVLVK